MLEANQHFGFGSIDIFANELNWVITWVFYFDFPPTLMKDKTADINHRAFNTLDRIKISMQTIKHVKTQIL